LKDFHIVSLLNPFCMNRNVYALLLAWLPLLALAQSAVFIPFGQTRSEVEHYLKEGQGYIQHSEFPSPDTIINYVNQRQTVTYFLNDDVLYAV
jgi:hypothetical protein